MSTPEDEAKGVGKALARRASAVLSTELAARPFARRKIYPLVGLSTFAFGGIALLFLINAFSIVNPALFGILMIGFGSMGWLAARPIEQWLRPQQRHLQMLHQRYTARLQALEKAMSVAELSQEQIINELHEAQTEYEAARSRVLEGKK